MSPSLHVCLCLLQRVTQIGMQLFPEATILWKQRWHSEPWSHPCLALHTLNVSILPNSVNGPPVFSGSPPIKFFREYINEKWKAHTPAIHYGNKYLPSPTVCLGTALGAKDEWVNTTEAQLLGKTRTKPVAAGKTRQHGGGPGWMAYWGVSTEVASCDWLWAKGKGWRQSHAETLGRARKH